MSDARVDHPDHYNHGAFEAIEVIRDNLSAEEFAGFCKGNALKYLLRASYKDNPRQDLDKAGWYLAYLANHATDPHAKINKNLGDAVRLRDGTLAVLSPHR